MALQTCTCQKKSCKYLERYCCYANVVRSLVKAMMIHQGNPHFHCPMYHKPCKNKWAIVVHLISKHDVDEKRIKHINWLRLFKCYIVAVFRPKVLLGYVGFMLLHQHHLTCISYCYFHLYCKWCTLEIPYICMAFFFGKFN